MIKFLIDPFNVFWILVLTGSIFYVLKKPKKARLIFLLSVFWFLLISTPLFPTLMLNTLENQFDPVKVEDLEGSRTDYHIIVLGGGHGVDSRLPQNSQLSTNALSRLNEGIRLQRQLSGSRLVLSGYAGSTFVSQAELLKQTAMLLGLDEGSLLVQSEPHNTIREAEVYSQSLAGDHPVIVVTSASHMPRAVMLFNQFGIDVIPSPTNYRLIGERRNNWFGLPSINNVQNLKISFYEYAAIIRYSI